MLRDMQTGFFNILPRYGQIDILFPISTEFTILPHRKQTISFNEKTFLFPQRKGDRKSSCHLFTSIISMLSHHRSISLCFFQPHRTIANISKISSRSMGLPKCPFMPASFDWRLSSSNTLADKAMIGILAFSGSSSLRIALVAS